MVSAAAIEILTRLATADGDTYLFGQRFDDAPLSLHANSVSVPGIDRNVAEELAIAGHIEDEAQRGESINVVFRITKSGRALLASMDQVVPRTR